MLDAKIIAKTLELVGVKRIFLSPEGTIAPSYKGENDRKFAFSERNYWGRAILYLQYE